jgi:biopolymer transport protein ExbB/TolQ
MSAWEAWLHEATGLLLTPVVVALVLAVAYALLAAGGFLRELLERRRTQRQWAAVTGGLPRAVPAAELRAAVFAHGRWSGLLGRFLAACGRADAAPGELVAAAARCEVAASSTVARVQLLARSGPTLGLMATLIPMGPALLALAADDIAGLARSLVVAFSGTVVGLLVGLVCTAIGSVRRHWYAADLVAIDELVGDVGGARS